MCMFPRSDELDCYHDGFDWSGCDSSSYSAAITIAQVIFVVYGLGRSAFFHLVSYETLKSNAVRESSRL